MKADARTIIVLVIVGLITSVAIELLKPFIYRALPHSVRPRQFGGMGGSY